MLILKKRNKWYLGEEVFGPQRLHSYILLNLFFSYPDPKQDPNQDVDLLFCMGIWKPDHAH